MTSLIRLRGAIVALLAASLSVTAAAAQEPGWRDAQGQHLPDSDSRRFVDGLGAWLIATTDLEDTGAVRAADDTLATALAREVHVVQRGTILRPHLFLLNAPHDASGGADVSCALRFTRPDGSEEKSYAMRCLDAANGGDANPRQAVMPIEFFADAGDPAGTWKVEVVVHDRKRFTTIAVSTTFELVDTD